MASTNEVQSHVGASFVPDGAIFRVWAPERKVIHVVLVDSQGHPQRTVRLLCGEDGYHSVRVAGVKHGNLYFYQVDGDPKLYPDPASHFQPQGVHGPSQVIDHDRFQWTDNDWAGQQLMGQVIYELHIGTFTPEGTWSAAQAKLPLLRDVGITLVEVMPVAAFFGKFGWGYDGVCWYAPTELYGEPDDFRRFVNEAHRLGMGVILDVVYNHFGPVGNYTGKFSPYYCSREHHTEWGPALNFDGEHSGPVREFIAENAAYWVREFHVDGLRLDATHAITDESDEHIVAQLTRTARAAARTRSILVFSEDERNRSHQVAPVAESGFGADGLWNDDFHHACRVAMTGNTEAYYADYAGTPQELISAIRSGYLYQGQWSTRQGKYRGCASRDVAAARFVHFLQNHDQVANAAPPVRTHLLTLPGRHRALTTLLLLGPQTPMLFMGQEFSASAPFFFFADHEPELAALVRKGRMAFMAQFPSIASMKPGRDLPTPSDPETFSRCKLDWNERDANEQTVQLHRDLVRLRREDPVFVRQDKSQIAGAAVAPEALVLRWYDEHHDDRMLLLNLGRAFDWCPAAEPLIAAPREQQWVLLWSSEDPRYGGSGAPAVNEKKWRVPGHSAIVFAASPRK